MNPVDPAMFALRALLALLFAASGWKHASNPEDRGESIGMSPLATRLLGLAELAGAAGLLFGVATSWAALGLAAVMAGAIYKKAFVWRTGLWGESGGGWYNDLLYLVCNLVIAAVGGGAISLSELP